MSNGPARSDIDRAIWANVPGQHDPLKNHAGPAHARQISGPTQLARGLMGRVGHLFALHGPAQLGTIFKWVVLV